MGAPSLSFQRRGGGSVPFNLAYFGYKNLLDWLEQKAPDTVFQQTVKYI